LFLSLTLSVHPSVCLSLCSFKSILFFVSRWNRAIFGRQFSVWHSTKLFSSIFDLGPLTPKSLLPKICMSVTESVIVCASTTFGPWPSPVAYRLVVLSSYSNTSPSIFLYALDFRGLSSHQIRPVISGLYRYSFINTEIVVKSVRNVLNFNLPGIQWIDYKRCKQFEAKYGESESDNR